MFKKLKIKKLISLLLVLLLSVNNFAAIVSDNDGSAFITKGEFDSIKNDFQTQINNYNTSIDSKIDGAIAQYLAGVQIKTNEEKQCLLGGREFEYVGLYDDVLWDYTYRSPHIEIDDYTASVRVDGSAKMYYIAQYIKAENNNDYIEGFYADLKSYTIASNKLTNADVKLNGFRRAFQTLTPSGNPNFESLMDSGKLDIHKWYITPSNGGNSCAFDSSDFAVDTFLDTAYYQHRSSSSTYGAFEKVYDNFFKAAHVIFTQNFTGTSSYYWLALDGDVEKLLINSVQTPALFIGGNDIKATTITETAKEYFNRADMNISTSTVQLKEGSSTWTRTPTKYDAPASIKMGVINGIGYFAGKNVEQQISDYSDKKTKVSISGINLAAGFPLLIEEKENQITWIPKFSDTTKTYRIWLSYEPFDKLDERGLPSTATDFIDINEKVAGQDYAEITSGSGKLTWTMSKTSPVYMKWAEMSSGTEVAKGTLVFKDCDTYNCITTD